MLSSLISFHPRMLVVLKLILTTHPQGLPILRQILADIYSRRFGRPLDPNRNICAAIGANEAILVALTAFLGPGDEVIVVQPVFVFCVQEIYCYFGIMPFTVQVDFFFSNSSAASSRSLFYILLTRYIIVSSQPMSGSLTISP